MDEAFRDALQFFGSLGGSSNTGQEERGFFEAADYEDFSLRRVLMGYGIPTIVSILLATLCFCYRDV